MTTVERLTGGQVHAQNATSQGGVGITFFGVRGSTPCDGNDIARYGGNTSCVSFAAPGHDPVLFDMGTGSRYFGQQQPADRTFRGHVLLSHLHWEPTGMRWCR